MMYEMFVLARSAGLGPSGRNEVANRKFFECLQDAFNAAKTLLPGAQIVIFDRVNNTSYSRKDDLFEQFSASA